MLSVKHDSSLDEVPSDDEQSYQVLPRGVSGQVICVQCRRDNDTSQGHGGGTLVSCRGSGGRGGTECGVSVPPGKKQKDIENKVNTIILSAPNHRTGGRQVKPRKPFTKP